MSYSKKRGFTDDFVVIDFETTGLYPNTCEIIEFGAVRYSGGMEIEFFQALVKPKGSIPAKASQVNRIYDKDVADKPSINEVLPDFMRFIGVDVLVAHNAAFDLSFLQAAIERYNSTHPDRMPFILRNKVADTLALAKYHQPNLKSYGLQNLIVQFNLGKYESHRSLGDCRATGALYLMLKTLATHI